MMRISVVVTTYNRPDALLRVLRGLVHQARLPDEIIVADDGSGESTRACVTAFEERCPVSLRHVWQADQGFQAARIRNMGIRESRGDYLIFLDGDCIPDHHFVLDHARLARPNHFMQGKRVLVEKALADRFDHQSANSDRLRWLLCRHISNRHHLLRLPWLPAVSSRRLTGIRSCNMGIYRTDLLAVNGFNEVFSGWGREDSELAVRLYRYGLKRLDHGFAAICFHLWHKGYSREEITHNDQLLADTIRSKRYDCIHGIVKTSAESGFERDLSEQFDPKLKKK
jgi:glycosyltransferase involved in cell wall biosynthesis